MVGEERKGKLQCRVGGELEKEVYMIGVFRVNGRIAIVSVGFFVPRAGNNVIVSVQRRGMNVMGDDM